MRFLDENHSQIDAPVSPIYTPAFIRSGIASGKFAMDDYGLEKLCTLCGDYWPADSQFFPLRDIGPLSVGLGSGCRACRAEMNMARRGLHVAGSGQGALDL